MLIKNSVSHHNDYCCNGDNNNSHDDIGNDSIANNNQNIDYLK